MTTADRNNAITAFMGGPKFLKENFFAHYSDAEFEGVGLKDLKYHTDWNWMIACWKKVRFQLSPAMLVAAICAIDEADLEQLHQIVSQVCINWCKEQKIM